MLGSLPKRMDHKLQKDSAKGDYAAGEHEKIISQHLHNFNYELIPKNCNHVFM